MSGFSRTGESFPDTGFWNQTMLPTGDTNPDAMGGSFSSARVPTGFGGPNSEEPVYFGPGDYADGYTGAGDTIYWGAFDDQGGNPMVDTLPDAEDPQYFVQQDEAVVPTGPVKFGPGFAVNALAGAGAGDSISGGSVPPASSAGPSERSFMGSQPEDVSVDEPFYRYREPLDASTEPTSTEPTAPGGSIELQPMQLGDASAPTTASGVTSATSGTESASSGTQGTMGRAAWSQGEAPGQRGLPPIPDELPRVPDLGPNPDLDAMFTAGPEYDGPDMYGKLFHDEDDGKKAVLEFEDDTPGGGDVELPGRTPGETIAAGYDTTPYDPYMIDADGAPLLLDDIPESSAMSWETIDLNSMPPEGAALLSEQLSDASNLSLGSEGIGTSSSALASFAKARMVDALIGPLLMPLFNAIDERTGDPWASRAIQGTLGAIGLLTSGDPFGVIAAPIAWGVQEYMKQRQRLVANDDPEAERGKKFGYVREGDKWYPAIQTSKERDEGWVGSDKTQVTFQYGNEIKWRKQKAGTEWIPYFEKGTYRIRPVVGLDPRGASRLGHPELPEQPRDGLPHGSADGIVPARDRRRRHHRERLRGARVHRGGAGEHYGGPEAGVQRLCAQGRRGLERVLGSAQPRGGAALQRPVRVRRPAAGHAKVDGFHAELPVQRHRIARDVRLWDERVRGLAGAAAQGERQRLPGA